MPVLPGAANGERKSIEYSPVLLDRYTLEIQLTLIPTVKGKNKPTEEEEDEEAELQKLQAEMAM